MKLDAGPTLSAEDKLEVALKEYARPLEDKLIFDQETFESMRIPVNERSSVELLKAILLYQKGEYKNV